MGYGNKAQIYRLLYDLQKEHDAYIDTIVAYKAFDYLIIDPSSNYQSFSESFREKDETFYNAYNKLKAILPESAFSTDDK